MTDLDALRCAVLADPADDTVRLAYADALEESGDRDRAEFVRVGVKLSRAGAPHKRVGSGDFPGPVGMRRAGPDYWVYHDGYRSAEVGDRVDVVGSVGASTRVKTHHGLLVTRVTDRGSAGVEYVVKRDADSGPWAGEGVAPRLHELLRLHEATWRRGRRCESPQCCSRTLPSGTHNCPACHGTGWLGSLAGRSTRDVQAAQNSGVGCCNRHADQMACNCLSEAIDCEWSRGFVVSVRITLDQLTREWGRRTCEKCKDGDQPGKRFPYWAGNIDCLTCAGCGTVPVPWAAALFREWPVERVVVTDRGPEQNPGGWSWFSVGFADDRATIQPALLDEMVGGDPSMLGQRISFPTAEAAHAALSLAVCRWGRAEAALLDDHQTQ